MKPGKPWWMQFCEQWLIRRVGLCAVQIIPARSPHCGYWAIAGLVLLEPRQHGEYPPMAV